MYLKPRTTKPSYHTIEADFNTLSKNHNFYLENFIDHPILSGGCYGNEIEKIKAEWIDKAANGASTEAIDLADLWTAYNQVKAQEVLYRTLLHQAFRKLYSYYPDLIKNFEIEYLSDDLFFKYIQAFKTAIEKNKELHLNCWDKPGIVNIEKQIALIAKLNKN